MAAVVDAATVAVQRLGYAAMKPEQLQGVTGNVSGRDVFAVVFCVSAFGFRPGTADWGAFDYTYCYSYDGYYEGSGKGFLYSKIDGSVCSKSAMQFLMSLHNIKF